jgi:branched-subunit amino acid transport protein
MSFLDYLFLFGGMGIVTYLPRWTPLFFLARQKLPKWFTDWLSLIPVAILCALLAPILFTNQSERVLELGKPEFLVAIPTLLFAVKTKSLGGTVLVGMGLFWGAKFILL